MQKSERGSFPRPLTVRVTGSLAPLKTAMMRWLTKGPRTFDDLVAAFGLPPTTIRRCLRELLIEGLLQVSTCSDSLHTWRQYGVVAVAPAVSARSHVAKSVAEDHSLSQYRRSLDTTGFAPDDV